MDALPSRMRQQDSGEEELGLFVAELGPLELAVDVASLGAHLLDIDDAVVAFAGIRCSGRCRFRCCNRPLSSSIAWVSLVMAMI